MDQDFEQKRLATGPELVLKNLAYKSPKLINTEYLSEVDLKEVWVSYIFLQPGKVDFIIRSA